MDSAGKKVVNLLLKDCSSNVCPYRAGDGGAKRYQLIEKVDKDLKHRVSDGYEVRILEAKVKILEQGLRNILAVATQRGDKSLINAVKVTLAKKEKK